MSVDNGAISAPNDEIDTDPNLPSAAPAQTQTPADNGEGEELDADGNPIVRDETAELEWDGKKWALPKDIVDTLKPALLRHGDYTKKTMEVADARRALDADRDGFTKQTEAQRAHFKIATKLASLDDQIAAGVQGIPYDKLDWRAWQAQDPDTATAAWRDYTLLKDQREAVARDYSKAEWDRTQNEARETGTRVQKAQAEIAKLIPEWTPGGELDVKMQKYGNASGYTDQVMAQATLLSPRFAYDLNRLRLLDEAAAKQKTQQTFDQSQVPKPVTRVGGNSGTASRRTTDSSGDALSTAEWAKREKARTSAQAARR